MEEKNQVREEIKRRIHEMTNELQALKELVDSEAFVPKEPELTEFEEGLVNFYNERSSILPDKDGVYNKHDCAELLHKSAKILLELAKKELCNGCAANLEGYIKGRQDARKEMDEQNHYVYKGPTIPTHILSCPYNTGGCTNPMRDCINCPYYPSVGINTATGTSTAKVEGWR